MRRAVLLAATLAAALFSPTLRSQTIAPAPADRTPAVDAVFARWSSTTPGCAVGVGVDGKPVLQRAYGMADLEHDVANTCVRTAACRKSAIADRPPATARS